MFSFVRRRMYTSALPLIIVLLGVFLLARLTAGQPDQSRPVFLFCGQTAITNQAATRYLARNHERLARKYGDNSFVLLLKVVNSHAYGPDVAELVADVTRAAQTPLPTVAAPRNSHRAS